MPSSIAMEWRPAAAAAGVLLMTGTAGYSALVRVPISEEPRQVHMLTYPAELMQHVQIGAGVEEDVLDLAEDEDVRAYVSRLWAEDWDSPEDSAYDRR